MAVVGRRQQRRPAVLGRLVDVRARPQQVLGGFEVAFARREHQRGQTRRRPSPTSPATTTSLSSVASAAGGAAAAGAAAGAAALRAWRRVRRRRWRGARGRAAAGAAATAGLSTAASRLRLGRSGAARSAKPAVDALEIKLLLVGSAGGRGGRPSPHRRLHGRGVDATRHVVSRQTGGPALRGGVGASVEQGFHRGRMLLFRRPHQRGRAAQRFLRVDVGAGGDEHVDRFGLSVSRREHQQRLAVWSALLDVGAGLDQLVDHRDVAVQAGHRERRDAFGIRGVELRAGANQQVRRVQIVSIDRPVQGRRAVHLRRVHVGLPLQQRAAARPDRPSSPRRRPRSVRRPTSGRTPTGPARQRRREFDVDSCHSPRNLPRLYLARVGVRLACGGTGASASQFQPLQPPRPPRPSRKIPMSWLRCTRRAQWSDVCRRLDAVAVGRVRGVTPDTGEAVSLQLRDRRQSRPGRLHGRCAVVALTRTSRPISRLFSVDQ